MSLSSFYADRKAFNDILQTGQDNALARQAGGLIADGNPTGAANALNRGGMLGAARTVQSDTDAQHKQEVEFAGNLATGIAKRIKAGADPEQAWQEGQQYAQTQGMGDHVPALRQQWDTMGPQAFTQWLGSAAAKEYQLFQNANGIYGVNKTDPTDVVTSKTFDPRAAAPHWVERKKADGSTEFIDLNETPQAPGQVQAQGGTPPDAEATWKAMIQRESGGRPGVTGPQTPYGRAQGMTQMLPATAQSMAQKLGVPWRPDLMTGTTPEAADYQQKLGRAYYDEGLQKYGGDTTKAAMYYHGGPDERLWGPKTRAYAAAVAPGNLQGGAGADTVGGRRVIPGSDPKPGESTAVDPNIVKGLIEGRISPPTQKAAATPYWQAQLEAATAQDPTFDGVNFQARAKTRADFTSGKSAVNITALNTVVGHLDSLDKSIDRLGNLSGFPGSHLNNQAAQLIARGSGTDQRIRDFETKKEAVANELTRVFRGTGGAEADIQAWKAQLDSSGSPESLRTVVHSMAELINSRLEALGEQYQQGMGTTKDPITLLTPDKQKAFKRLQGGQAEQPQPAAASGWSVKRLR